MCVGWDGTVRLSATRCTDDRVAVDVAQVCCQARVKLTECTRCHAFFVCVHCDESGAVMEAHRRSLLCQELSLRHAIEVTKLASGTMLPLVWLPLLVDKE